MHDANHTNICYYHYEHINKTLLHMNMVIKKLYSTATYVNYTMQHPI